MSRARCFDHVHTASGETHLISSANSAFGFLPGRVTYVLDKEGQCVSVYDNLADAASHLDKAKESLEALPAKKAGFELPFELPF